MISKSWAIKLNEQYSGGNLIYKTFNIKQHRKKLPVNRSVITCIQLAYYAQLIKTRRKKIIHVYATRLFLHIINATNHKM